MERITIEAADNGFIVEYRDPEIEASNAKKGSSYRSPYRRVVCESAEKVVDALEALVPLLKFEPEETKLSKAFAEALNVEKEDD